MTAPFDVLPLVVGVTGHRDLPPDAETSLRASFEEALDRIQQRHPGMRLLVLSGLAAGADVLAAEVALDRGIAVLGCLPAPQAQYELDFSAQELGRFRRVLPRCWDVVVIGSTADRRRGYVEVAEFIAYYSHVLVAFWDGSSARGPGGTADVVELRKGGIPGVIGDALIAYIPDVGPVIQIVTPRAGQPRPDGSFALREIFPEGMGSKGRTDAASDRAGERDFETAIDHVQRFNVDLAREPAPGEADPLAALCDRVDFAANSLQRRMLWSVQSLYIATALAGAAQLALPADGSFHIPTWAGIALRIAFLAIAFVVFVVAKRSDYENRYQDYRAIAEALRVQYAWSRAGLRNRLVEASYLQMQQGELAWIRLALRTAYLITGGRDARDDDSPAHDACIRWIEGQLAYYERSGEREVKRQQAAQRASVIAGIGGAVISGAAAVFAWAISHGAAAAPGAARLGELSYWAAVPVALGSMLALLIRFYAQQRGFAENARRYQHMFTVFDAAKRRLGQGIGDPRKVMEQLGHEALSEHAEWLILHRDRPLTFVHT